MGKTWARNRASNGSENEGVQGEGSATETVRLRILTEPDPPAHNPTGIERALVTAISGCPINRAFTCNTLNCAGLREKREFGCESYVFGQAGYCLVDGPIADAHYRGDFAPREPTYTQGARTDPNFQHAAELEKRSKSPEVQSLLKHLPKNRQESRETFKNPDQNR